MSLASRWEHFRSAEGWRWATMVVAVVVGLLVASLHWLGLFVGGAIMGLAAATRGRALLAGLGFGVLVWLVFAVQLALSGDVAQYLQMGQIFWVSLAVPIVAGTVGALVRWLVG